MPYFVFKIPADGALEHIETFDAFPEAMRYCRAQRAQIAAPERVQVRMVFAEQLSEGRRLLGIKRPAPTVEEWEV